MAQPFLSVEGLARQFPGDGGADNPPVFENLHFAMERGEFVCVLGHSGCGKTTILNILAGLDEATAGNVIMAGREVKGPSLERGVVFQSHALMPWLTAQENVEFAVRSRWPEWTRSEVRAHALRYLEMVHLAHAAGRKPAELSGGMKQRVGIARAFAIQPRMLLLDEPFGALDALTRGSIQSELMEIVADTQQTVFMITHDVDEAILLADRIVLMTNGPRAMIAEIVVNTLPRPRAREDIHKDPAYYPIRNHLVDFLVKRSRDFTPPPGHDIRHPTHVVPASLPGPAGAPALPLSSPLTERIPS